MLLRWLIVLCALLGLPTLSQAQCPGLTSQITPFATETLLIDGTVKPLTASVYRPTGTTPSLATITVEGGSIRYMVVGTPTSTTGHPAGGNPPQTFSICGLDSITAFRATRGSGDATLTITYYRPKNP